MKTKLLGLSLLVLYASAVRADEAELASADNVFAFKLLRQLSQAAPHQNIFISPYSAAAVLQMAANGAAGTTKKEMQAALGTTKLADNDVNDGNRKILTALNTGNTNVILNTANAIWVQNGFAVKPDFIASSQSFFAATVGNLDFAGQQSVDTINHWANEKTHGKIPSLLSVPLGQSTRLLLANAVYFKGKWADPFEVKDTRDHPFHLPDGSQKMVPLMYKNKTFTYRRGTGYQAVRLPYQDENLAMYVFLPDTNSSPEKLLELLNGDTWKRITRPGFGEKDGTLELPRFKLDYSAILNQPLKALGMKTAFNSSQADFSDIAPQLYISTVLQKTFVEVKEEGTEAAAVTAVVMMSAAMPMPPANPFTMIVNRPFLFLIEDSRTGTILFVGTIYDPSQDS